MGYKWCVVPKCLNTSIRSPNKLFVCVPKNPKRRKMWLQLSRRDPNEIVMDSNVFMCEDHFELQNDMENYTEYKIMGSAKRIRMKINCIPSRFECQKNRKHKSTSGRVTQHAFIKKKKKSKSDKSNTRTIEVSPLDNRSYKFQISDQSKTNDASSQEEIKTEPKPEHDNLIRCAKCMQAIKGCVLVCVQCADSKWCGACADLALHPQHYLIRVPPSRPKDEISEVRHTIKLMLSDQRVRSEETKYVDNEVGYESERTISANEFDDETRTTPEVPDQYDTEDMLVEVKKEVEGYDPLMVIKEEIEIDETPTLMSLSHSQHDATPARTATFTHTHAFIHKPSHTHTPTVTHKPSHTHTPPVTHKPSHTHTPTITHKPSHTHTPAFTYKPSHTPTPALTHTQATRLLRGRPLVEIELEPTEQAPQDIAKRKRAADERQSFRVFSH